jgi:SAM-dependent methyltransferase
MDLEELQRNWDQFGEQDPMWAILTEDDKRGGKWDVGEFFQSGATEIQELVDRLGDLGMAARGVALDFGCGVGRLTQALGDHFDEAWGVDIAPSMIEGAQRFNRHGDRVHYVVNDRPDLRRFDDATFDLVFSVIVLQHIRSDIALGYVREFFRICKPGGAVVFQLPSHRMVFPDGAYAAEISAEVPARVTAGDTIDLTVHVRNAGDAEWPRRPDVLRLANHWLDAGGTTVEQDSGREPLPREVAPGATIDLTLHVPVPARSGRHVLELDLVHEGITWFADRGSSTLTAPVEIVGEAPTRRVARRLGFRRPAPDAGADSGTTDDGPVMEMHPVPREEVLELIGSLGGTVLDVEANTKAPPWESYTYYVAKPATPSRNDA